MKKQVKINNKIEEEVKIERFIPIDRCLFWKEEGILVIGDLHLGYEQLLQEQGWSFPNTQIEETLAILEKILKQTGKLNKVIILGDVKHHFGGILTTEWEDFYLIVALLKENLKENGEIIITKGNHDNMIDPIIAKYNFVKLKESYFYKGVLFFHRHKESFNRTRLERDNKRIEIVVIGHFHPAISIRDSTKQEKYRCFLLGNYKSKKLIIIPSFFPLNEGTDVIQEKLILEDWFNILGFEAYLVADRVYDFGRVDKLV